MRRKRLSTFSTSQAERRHIKQVEKRAKISQRYLKKSVVWLTQHGGNSSDLETLLGPPSPVPRALTDSSGFPYKGTKSSTTTYLERQYTNPSKISNMLPMGWIPHSVILEGMFLIQMAPIPSMGSMEEYVKLLLSRYVRPHFNAGAIEVHVVFDVAGLQEESPKEIEQRRRDSGIQDISTSHHCTDFCSDLIEPERWRSVLGCRTCKANLTVYIADDMLRFVAHSLHSNQQFITNIAGKAYSVRHGQSKPSRPDLCSNALYVQMQIKLTSGSGYTAKTPVVYTNFFTLLTQTYTILA